MAEVIAQVDIDVEALINKAAETRQKLLEITGELKTLKSEFEKGNVSVSEYTKQVTELNAIEKVNRDELRVYDTMLKNTISTEATKMQSNKVMTGSIKEISAALSQNKLIYQQLNEEQREGARGQALLKTIQEQDAKYKELQKSIGNTQVEVGNYKQAILEALGEQGAFGFSLNGIVNTFNDFKEKASAIITPFSNFVNTGRLTGPAMSAAAGGTKKVSTAMKVLRGAIISTGIGALIVALGSLISYFTSTQEGADKLSRVLTPIKVVFASIYGVVQNVGKAIAEAFSKTSIIKDLGNLITNVILLPIKQVIGVVKGLGKVLTGDFKGAWEAVKKPTADTINSVKKVGSSAIEAGKQVAEGFKGAGSVFKEAWERGKRIEEISIKLASSEAAFVKKNSELSLEFEKQNEILRDTSKTLKERQEAGRKSIEIQEQINKLAKERNDLEVERMRLQQQSNDTSDAEKAELERKIAEKRKANEEMIKADVGQRKQLNKIDKEISDEAVKRAEEAKNARLKALEEESKAVEAYLNTNSPVAASLEERLRLEEEAMQKRLSILDREYKLGKYKKAEYEREKANIELEYDQLRAELSIEAVQKELERYEAANQSKVGSEVKLTEELITQEVARQEAIYQKKVEALEREKELKQQARQWDYNDEAAHQDALAELNFDKAGVQAELQAQMQAQQKEEQKAQEAADFEEKIATMQAQGAAEWEVDKAQMDHQYEEEWQALLDQLNNEQISREEFDQKRRTLEAKQAKDAIALEKKTEAAKLQLASSTLSSLKSVFGEQSEAGKAVAVAETTIATYKAATNAYASMAGISVVGPALGAAAAAAAIAAGLANVKKIMNTDTKYAEGGLVRGRSHAQGGVPFSVAGVGGYEMEGGEYIVNRAATAHYFPILEQINNSTRTGGYNAVRFASGGIVRGAEAQKIDYSQITKAIREGAMEGTQAGAFEGTRSGAFEGAQAGSLEGSKLGSMEGAMQGAYEGTNLGTSSGLAESSLRIGDNDFIRKTAVI